MNLLEKLAGDPTKTFLGRHQKTVAKINALEPEFEVLSDGVLRERFQTLKISVQEHLEKGSRDPLAILELKDRQKEKQEVNAALTHILPEAFAAVREAAKRSVGQRHFDVQLLGGIALHLGNVAEMKTGEGKTLVATLPLCLNALLGRGAHLVTVNDYLAKLAVEVYGPVYESLGLSVAVIANAGTEPGVQPSWRFEHGVLVPCTRRDAYACDVTYGTNNEFGFDYLRDNMAPSLQLLVQRELCYAIVDEADSVLIDEARTPLIISGPAEESADLYMRFSQLVPRLVADEDYVVDEKDRAVSLTQEGIAKMERLLGVENIYGGEEVQLAYHLEEALKARLLFKRDKEYVVQNGEVVIVDEFTGRLMPGRRYGEGLHQAIEAKEGVVIQRESDTLATISFQNLFRLYTKLAGMTGTAKTEEEEFIKIYGLEVVPIPTNRPMVRADLADRVYTSETGKFQAVVSEVKERNLKGQPVLIGTVSIEKNERLAASLQKAGVPHEVLNAKNNEREAHIIAQAGRKGAVTLATNLAGRGTDIMLGGIRPSRKEFESETEYEKAAEIWRNNHDEVVALGGLHVVGTERHESRRIDNQLRGRAGRQGDPGSSQFYISTDDDLMRIFGGERMKSMLSALGQPEDEAIEHKFLSRAIESAQKRVEGHNFDQRKQVVQYDDVMNRHREVIYQRRRGVMLAMQDGQPGGEVERVIEEGLGTEARHLVGLHASGYTHEWNLPYLTRDVAVFLNLNETETKELGEELPGYQSDTGIEERLGQLFHAAYARKREQFGPSFPNVLRALYLNSVDTLWRDHLTSMTELRKGIGLQGYAQTDPLVAYKAEGYRLFQYLLKAVEGQTMRTIFRVEPAPMAAIVGPPSGTETRIG
jgi:preprotein translocase subunit SecA